MAPRAPRDFRPRNSARAILTPRVPSQATIQTIVLLADEAGVTAACSLNIAVSDGTHVVVSRYRSSVRQDPPSLYFRVGGSFACEGGKLVASAAADGKPRAVFVCSEPLSTTGRGSAVDDEWTLIPKDHLLVISGRSVDEVPASSVAGGISLRPISLRRPNPAVSPEVHRMRSATSRRSTGGGAGDYNFRSSRSFDVSERRSWGSPADSGLKDDENNSDDDALYGRSGVRRRLSAPEEALADDISADDANGDGASVAALGRPPSLDRDNQLSFIRMRLRKLNSELAVAEANGIHSAPIDASTGATSARLRGGSEEEGEEEAPARAGRRRGGGGGGSLAGSATWCGLAIGGLALAFALGRARAAASA